MACASLYEYRIIAINSTSVHVLRLFCQHKNNMGSYKENLMNPNELISLWYPNDNIIYEITTDFCFPVGQIRRLFEEIVCMTPVSIHSMVLEIDVPIRTFWPLDETLCTFWQNRHALKFNLNKYFNLWLRLRPWVP